MMTLRQTIRAIFVGVPAPDPDRPIIVLWATAMAFAVMMLVGVCA